MFRRIKNSPDSFQIFLVGATTAFLIIVSKVCVFKDDPSSISTESSGITKSDHSPNPLCADVNNMLFRCNEKDLVCGKSRPSETNIQKELVFLHIPKTGGESLENALEIKKNHKTWRQRRGETVLNSSFLVTIIRNPFDRMLSWFRFCLHGWRGHLPGPKRALSSCAPIR